MELNVLEKKKHRFVFELPGADHTLCNSLKTELWNDEDVAVATYVIKHPLLAVPKFIVETKSGDARDAVLAASARVQKRVKGLQSDFAKI